MNRIVMSLLLTFIPSVGMCANVCIDVRNVKSTTLSAEDAYAAAVKSIKLLDHEAVLSCNGFNISIAIGGSEAEFSCGGDTTEHVYVYIIIGDGKGFSVHNHAQGSPERLEKFIESMIISMPSHFPQWQADP